MNEAVMQMASLSTLVWIARGGGHSFLFRNLRKALQDAENRLSL